MLSHTGMRTWASPQLYLSAHRCLQTQWGQTRPQSQSRKVFPSPSSSPDLSTWSIQVPKDVTSVGHFLTVGGERREVRALCTHHYHPFLVTYSGATPEGENGEVQ